MGRLLGGLCATFYRIFHSNAPVVGVVQRTNQSSGQGRRARLGLSSWVTLVNAYTRHSSPFHRLAAQKTPFAGGLILQQPYFGHLFLAVRDIVPW